MNDPLLLVRTAHYASVSLLAGLLLFLLLVAEPLLERPAIRLSQATIALRRRFVWITCAALAVAIMSGAAWLVLLAARISGESFEAVISDHAAWNVLTKTRFGEDWLVRLGLSVLMALWLFRYDRQRGWRSPWDGPIAASLGACLIATLAWAGHGGAGSGSLGAVQLAGDAVHLIAAAAWIGGLVPFAVLMARASLEQDATWDSIASDATARFSILGILTVGLLIVTGVLNSWFLVGSVPGLVGTAYGRLLLAKIGLFVAMVGVAAVNRLALLPRLLRREGSTGRALAQLRRNAFVEAVLGLLILGIVGALGTLPPAAHTQPNWPFPFRLALEAFGDPSRGLELLVTAVVAAIGLVSFLGGILIVRLRWPMLVLGALLAAWSAPRLAPLVQQAYPTSFYASPTGYSARSIAAGEDLFAQHCVSCHGPHGLGNGPAAKDLQPPPADLTAEHIYAHRDGDLFWWITNGIGDAMPPFGGAIGETARWNLIDFIHANADARRWRTASTGTASVSVPAPNFTVDCPGGATASIDELRGRIIHLLFAGPRFEPRLRQVESLALGSDVSTIAILPEASGAETLPVCSTDSADVVRAYALLGGVGSDEMEGTEFLVDASGSLRSMWRPGGLPDWSDAETLMRSIDEVRRTPRIGPSATPHVHVH